MSKFKGTVVELGIPGVYSEQGLINRISDLTHQAKVNIRPFLGFAYRRLNTRMFAKDVLHVLLNIVRVAPSYSVSRYVLVVGSDTNGKLRQILIFPQSNIIHVITVDIRQRMALPEIEKRRQEDIEHQWEQYEEEI